MFFKLGFVKIERFESVDFSDNDKIALFKHQRIFERFVVALGYGQQHHVEMRARIELGRTYEIADIFKHDEVALVKRRLIECLAHHIRVDMAKSAVVNLHALDACAFRYTTRVNVGFYVNVHRNHFKFVFQAFEQCGQKSGFAASGRRHNVEKKRALALESRSQLVGGFIVV